VFVLFCVVLSRVESFNLTLLSRAFLVNSTTFHPRMLACAIENGVFPMSIDVWDVAISALKLHVERCIMNPPGIVHKKTRKRASKFSFTINQQFERVCELIVKDHDNCWLVPRLQRSLKYIRDHPQGSDKMVPQNTNLIDSYLFNLEFPQIRVLSWEVWSNDVEDALVAGEIGFIVGSIYCSMTGAFDKSYSGAGNVQLATTGGWLVKHGIKLWDL
jgi:Leu/Phe-tRNA-protein transferase